ncbi:MAG: response regulator [Candidatus Brocadiaceae bacterium]|nr:response regulator [Candidatus Brocadiaceae bacterium]
MHKKILIIEDEDDFYFFYSLMLENTPYSITRAINGNEAFKIMEEEKPDLIILDLLLEQVSGEVVLKQLKADQRYADIPVIIASSFSERSYKTLFEIEPNLVFLEKPFDQETLLEAIKNKVT